MNFSKTKNKFLFSVILIFGFLFSSNNLFAYDEIIVHPSLTAEMAKLYNLNYGEKLTDQEIEWMKKGAKDEDDRQGLLIRSGNHFYNPFGIKKWADNTLIGNSVPEPKLTSKEWAHDSLEQDSFPGGDFTWERGIWDYANGDKQHAYESLGHIMHLIEDSTVPAHVRNDLHISPNDKDLEPYKNILNFEEIKKTLQDGEPYEAWTGGKAWSHELNYDFADTLFKQNKKPIILTSINEYFDNIAKYTNTNFFSKDTIYVYAKPNNFIIEGNEKLDNGDIVEYVYGFDGNNNRVKLAKISYDKNKNQRIYTLMELGSEIENNIHSDYWSHLAPRAVLTGAGIIKLFKDEANKAAQNPQSVERPKSIASVYGPLAPAIRSADPSIRNIATAGQLLANASIYISGKTLNVIYDSVRSSVFAFFDFGKTQVAAAYSAAENVGNFFNSSAKSISQYFTTTAKAELKFDVSDPLSKGIYSVEEIIKQLEAVAAVKAQAITEPAYSASAWIAAQNQNLSFSPGEEISLSAKIKNTGSAIWQGEKISLNIYSVSSAKFYHSSWLTRVRPASLGKIKIAPEETGVLNFIAAAPLIAGDYVFRVRPVWQRESGEFNWLSDDILSWRVRVEPPKIAAQEETITNPPDQNNEQITEAGKTEAEILALENNLPEEEIASVVDQNAEEEKLENEALADDETARLAEEEAARLKEEEELKMRRRRAWLSIPPETTIIGFPEKTTFETSASFKLSSSKPNSTFLCALKEAGGLAEDAFADCGEYTIYNDLIFGEHILKVKAKDEFGNIDQTPAEYSWTIEKIKSAPHLVISEIIFDAQGSDAGKEFIELYNPTDNPIYADDWSLKYIKDELLEMEPLATFDKTKENVLINKNGFFLVGFNNYVAGNYNNILADASRSAVLLNGEKDGVAQKITIILFDNSGNETDRMVYDKDSIAVAGQSLERKALQDNICDTAQGKKEFSGNGCDTGDMSDFEIRLLPNPQNSASLAEPALTPAHNITNGLDYPTIQWAIDKASAGDEIQVDSGTYYENVKISKQLILKGVDIGEGKPVINAGGIGNGITLFARNITVYGFTVTNSASSAENAGIFANAGDHAIENNDVSNNSNGIYLQYSSNNTLIGNNISNNAFGFYLKNSSNNILENNNVSNNAQYGIILNYGGNNMLGNNNISLNNYAGIGLNDSDNNIINANIVFDSNHGILLNGRYNQFIGNTIKGQSDGFFIANGYNNIIRENSLRSSYYSIDIFSGEDNKIYHNNFISIANGAFDIHGLDEWDDGYPSGGNYWSDYQGADSDSDGIGDAPVYIPCAALFCQAAAYDRYPLMVPYAD